MSFQRPSWKSTVFVALVAFLFSFSVAICFVVTWVPEIKGDQQSWSSYSHRESLSISVSFIGGFVGGLLAAWAWRSAPVRRFHITFVSGLVLLRTTYAYVRHVMRTCFATAAAGQDVTDAYLATPLIATYAGALSIIILLSALYLDRR